MVTEASGVGSLVRRPAAGGYDRIDTLGGIDHRRRLVDHAVGEQLNHVAATWRELRRLDDALAYHERALALFEAAAGTDHSKVA